MFSNIPENKNYFTTKAEYEEYGPDYMKEHCCSNNYNFMPNSNMNFSINKTNENVSNQSEVYFDNETYSPNKKAKIN